jgi:hypothetical protein
MSGIADASSGETEATLTDLAEKLSELRVHLEDVVADLNGRRGEISPIHDERGTTTAESGTDNRASENGRLRCYGCGRMEAKGAAGWTLRLCPDDELHTFCPDCDSRYLNSPYGRVSATGQARPGRQPS